MSCFLGDGLLGVLGDLFGERVKILWGVLVGVDVSGSNQDGFSLRLDTVTVECFEGIFVVSGLSLALLSVLPLGGLTPRLG